MRNKIVCVVGVLLVATQAFCAEGEYARVFRGSADNVNLGPTGITGMGIKIDNKIEFFVVTNVERGSPADGIIREDDVINGANGVAFPKQGDARKNLGYAIIDSQAKNGRLHLQVIRGTQKSVETVQLDRIPDFSATWPFACERTDMMLAAACDFLDREQQPSGEVPSDEGLIGQTQSGILFMAMGEPRYLDNGRRAAYWYGDKILEHVRKGSSPGWGPWQCGYGGLLMAEYYEMTGDRGILPALKAVCKFITDGQTSAGGWSHGWDHGYGAGYAEVNEAGMVCYMALTLARECGVEVDEMRFRRAEKYYENYAPAVTSSYGDNISPSAGYETQNGKIGGLAVVHRLNDRKGDSAAYALKSARSFNGIESGHTGHFFNLLWTPVGASFAPAEEYRKGLDGIGWYYAMSQTWRGGFFCQPNPGSGKRNKKYAEYGQMMTTGGIGLSLAFPRRHLRIHGAPMSVFAVKLPAALDAARKLSQEQQYDQAIAAVDDYLKKAGLDAETIRLANELRDKTRYVKEGNEAVLAKMDAWSSGHRLNMRAYEVSQMLEVMKTILGEDNPRLKAIEERLPSRGRDLWRAGEDYYKILELAKNLRPFSWFLYTRELNKIFPDAYQPKPDLPFTTIAEMPANPGTWKPLVVADRNAAPKGWENPSFDDTAWTMPKDRKGNPSIPRSGYLLVRWGFEMESMTAQGLQLKVKSLLPGSKVYLNGELVLETQPLAGQCNNPTLLPAAANLLRKGRNVLAYETPAEGGALSMGLAAQLQSSLKDSFTWTPVPGRDVDIYKLVAQRGGGGSYYNSATDRRTSDDLMKVFQAEPTFMPDIYHALKRYADLSPSTDVRSKHVTTLLRSPVWGGRLAGLYLVEQALETMSGNAKRGLSEEERARVDAEHAAAVSMCDKQIDQVITLLKDPNALVRRHAAIVLGNFGDKAKAAIPVLVEMVGDYDGQNWWTRSAVWSTLGKMQLDQAALSKATVSGLHDPAAGVRKGVLGRTFLSQDIAVQKASIKNYKDDLIDQVFTVPYGMFTSGMRRGQARYIVEHLSSDELRQYLPRMWKALAEEGGDTLGGAEIIIASFGEEVVPKLKALVDGNDRKTGDRALETLQLVIVTGKGSPELAKWVRARLEAVKAAENGGQDEWAKKLLRGLDKPAEGTAKEAPAVDTSAAGDGDGDDSAE